jgi:hypothetical protein
MRGFCIFRAGRTAPLPDAMRKKAMPRAEFRNKIDKRSFAILRLEGNRAEGGRRADCCNG